MRLGFTVAALLLCATPALAGPRTLVLLHATQPAADDAALAQAVTIYTRDLDYDVQVGGDVTPEITPEGLGRVITWVRVHGVRMAFWAESRRRDEAVLYAVGITNGRIAMNALRVAGVVGHEMHRALALKVRAVLTGAADVEKNEPLPAPKLPPEPPPPPPPKIVYVQVPGPPPKIVTPPPPSPYRARLRVAADYRATIPTTDLGLVRHGVVVDASLPLGSWIELALGVDVATSPTKRIAEGAASLFDLPVRAAMRVRLERGRIRVLAGPVVSLHVLSATAIGFDGTRGDATRVGAGLGGEIILQARITDHVAIDTRALVEGIVPDERFQLHGALAIDAGGALVGLGAGLAFSAP